jgi:hypothetical protein
MDETSLVSIGGSLPEGTYGAEDLQATEGCLGGADYCVNESTVNRPGTREVFTSLRVGGQPAVAAHWPTFGDSQERWEVSWTVPYHATEADADNTRGRTNKANLQVHYYVDVWGGAAAQLGGQNALAPAHITGALALARVAEMLEPFRRQ